MLNPFPELLVFGYFAPTILRIAVALVFIYLAFRTWSNASELSHVRLPLVGAQGWFPYVAALAEGVLGLMFLVGWYTQIAAILGIVGMLKYAAYKRWWPRALEFYVPFSTATAFLVGIICLSLLISGAGALAFDLPL